MRKVLTIALVALMSASLFAGVKTSGYVQGAATYVKNEKSNPILLGNDDDNKAQVVITDENEVWGTTLYAQKQLFKTNTWVDLMKLAKVDSDFKAKLSILTGDKLTTLSAYRNLADQDNYWRLRNEMADGTSFNTEIGYNDLVKAQAGMQIWQGSVTRKNREDKTSFFTSVLVTPVEGFKASAGYGIYDLNTDKDAYVLAADIDFAKIASLDFSFGFGLAYTNGSYYDKDSSSFKKYDDGIFTAQVFGDFGHLTAYCEISYFDFNEFKLGATYRIDKNLVGGAYIYFNDYDNFDATENTKFGVDATYTVNKNIELYGIVEWEKRNLSAEGRCKVSF